MRLDGRLKQIFPFILTGLVALIAYLQALGLGHLFAGHLDNAVVVAPRAIQTRVQQATAWAARTLDGGAILARNPFDSITGPLKGRDDTPTSIVENNEDPYADPFCESARVLLITTTDDPSWSFAAIAVGREKAQLRRIGDAVGDRVVYAMTWDRIWMTKNEARCQVPLHKDKHVSIQPPPPPPPPGPLEFTNKITKISDTIYDVDRSIVPMITENPLKCLGPARILPIQDADGKSLKILGIRPDSALGSVGLRNGDKLQTINGFDISDPMSAMHAYQRLLSADKLTVQLVRAGKPMTIEINMH